MSERIRQEIERLDRLAVWLDARYRVPGTSFRLGWDGILGLVPLAGDVVAFGPACYLVWRAGDFGASGWTTTRMALNTGLDFAFGSIPILGTVFDVFYKANLRNIALLRADLARKLEEEARAESGG